MSDRYRGGGGWSLRGPELVGILLIIVGAVYFLGNANIIRISWSLVWPLLVIGLGLIVLIQALRPRGAISGSAHIPRDGVQQLELDLGVGAGEFRVAGGATSLIDVQSNRDDISARVNRAGSRSTVRLRQDAGAFPFGGRTYSQWDVRLADDVAAALSIQGGAGTFDVDLATLRVVDARMTFGAATARVTLPTPSGELAIRIASGAASVTVRVPPGVEARVQGTGGLMQIEGRTETPGYATATNRVNVTVTGGASQIRVI